MFDFIDPFLGNIWLLIVLLIGGFVLLVKGADWLVDGASSLAKRFGISDLVIGLTVVAFGTSMPEFVVNMVSVAEGSTDLAITNILGSNIINTFVILGLTALVYPVISQKRSRDFDIPMSIIAAVLVFAMVVVESPFGEEGRGISRMGGIILLVLFAYFLYNTFRHAKDHPDEAEAEAVQPMVAWKAILLVLVGLVGLVVGGELIVKSAVARTGHIGYGRLQAQLRHRPRQCDWLEYLQRVHGTRHQRRSASLARLRGYSHGRVDGCYRQHAGLAVCQNQQRTRSQTLGWRYPSRSVWMLFSHATNAGLTYFQYLITPCKAQLMR